ncbi:multidrug efflux pump subunit AcrA (membrane-fusion protein) [Actinoplanes xinjiangensis]|uniref:Multidrug efflux pump subunit AcrA (Membrane-fusion protein) n=1 Tax=Actinoplanes xinjiangensis TaxID=512350 RepID=A0A316FEU3_9ACTN|nr:multidrug efflux pump subunit AcrA (membrane-fusion protein) [Actinoplanes xinjiangensis]
MSGAAVTVAAGVALGVNQWAPRPHDQPPPPTPHPTTVIKRESIAQVVTVEGRLGYGTENPLDGKTPGTITWLAGADTIIKRGGTLLRVDNERVVLLHGAMPVYRALAPGLTGPDVKQLERNLSALGYAGFTADDEFTSATADAVRRWQHDLGRPETGRVDSSWVVIAKGDVRISEVRARVGDPGTGPIYTWTGTQSVVTVKAEVGKAGWARTGTKVTVSLPTGKDTKGTVTSVGAKISPGTDGGEPTIPVTIRIDDRKTAGGLRDTPVEVGYVSEERKDVLAVPVAALLALPEGGYGLQLDGPGGTRYLPVKLGMFAGGKVEVSGDGVTAGLQVVMPQ